MFTTNQIEVMLEVIDIEVKKLEDFLFQLQIYKSNMKLIEL
jgi:hypothetical protein